MTVAELLSRISSRELSQWIEFYQLEPLGNEASYYGSAVVASTVANVHRAKGSKAYKVEEFLPRFGKRKESQSVDEMLQFARMMTVAMGGQDLRDKGVDNDG